MSRERAYFTVSVELDPTGGPFGDPERAAKNLLGIIQDRIGHYEPTVEVRGKPREETWEDIFGGSFVLPSKKAATEFLDRVDDLLEKYNQVTVADTHELLEQKITHKQYHWGWKTFEGVKIETFELDGQTHYEITPPRPERL